MDFSEAVQKLSKTQEAGIVHVLSRDRGLSKLVAVWPMMQHRRNSKKRLPDLDDALSVVDLRERVWEVYDHDTQHACAEIRAFLGSTFPAAEKLRQAKKAMLVLPGGVVHSIADRLVIAESSQILKAAQSERGAKRNG